MFIYTKYHFRVTYRNILQFMKTKYIIDAKKLIFTSFKGVLISISLLWPPPAQIYFHISSAKTSHLFQSVACPRFYWKTQTIPYVHLAMRRCEKHYITVKPHTHTHIYIYIYIYICVCVCVCVCLSLCLSLSLSLSSLSLSLCMYTSII